MIAMLSLASMAFAQDDDLGFSGKGQFGYVKTSGNSDTESINLGLDFTYTQPVWTHTFGVKYLSAEDSGQQSADRWQVAAKSQRAFGGNKYVYGGMRYEEDEFSSYESQLSATVGVGIDLSVEDNYDLKLEAGLGARRFELVGGAEETDAIARFFADYANPITETTTIENTFLAEAGEENTYLENILGVKVSMTDALALKVAYEVRHNTDVLPGTDKTDSVVGINLVYDF